MCNNPLFPPVGSHDSLVGGRKHDTAGDEVDKVDVDEFFAERVCPLAERERQVWVHILKEDVPVSHHATLGVYPFIGWFPDNVEELQKGDNR